MKDLPAFLTIPAALIWIATRNFEACHEAFEAVESFQRNPFPAEDDKVTVWVPVRHFGLTAVSVIIAKYLHPDDRTIRDKWGTFAVLDDGRVRLKGKKRDTAAVGYEYAPAERELLRALRAKSITADTSHPDNSVSEIKAALWWMLDFKDEEGKDGHYHVVATAAGKDPLWDISFKKDEILRQWPPKGGRKRGPKVGEASPKALLWREAEKMLEDGKVQRGRGAATEIANRLHEMGYKQEPDTIRRYIAPSVKDWIEEHKMDT